MSRSGNPGQPPAKHITALAHVLCAALFSVLPAATHYVATDGQDLAGDGSLSSPWATVGHALTSVHAGDSIKIKPGRYNLSSPIIIRNETDHDNLTLTAADSTALPVLNGSPLWDYVILVAPGVNGVTLSYLEVKQGDERITTWREGVIFVRDNPVTVDHCIVYNGFNGISVDTGINVTLSNNIVHTMGAYDTDPDDASGAGHAIAFFNYRAHPSLYGRQPAASGWHEKILISNNECYGAGEDGFQSMETGYEYIEIANNNFHHNFEDAIDLKAVKHVKIHHNWLHHNYNQGIVSHVALGKEKGDGDADHVEVYANRINNNGWGAIFLKGSDCTDWKIYNNLIYANCDSAASWGGYCVNLGGGTGMEFNNNTVYKNLVKDSRRNMGITGRGPGLVIKNNAFRGNGIRSEGNISSSTTGTIDHNYVYPTTPGVTGTNAVTNPEPMFTDPANGDFSLRKGSPLIDAGAELEIEEDFNGKSRPAGKGVDIGAIEYQESGN